MEITEIKNLKDILNERYPLFKEKTAFLEKDGVHKESQKISYAKLKEDIDSLGSVMLKKLGLKDKKVAVIGENSYAWFVTYMAVTCGVGIIVPLDKELPQNEIENLMKRAGVSAIIFSSRKKEMIQNIKEALPKDMIYIEMAKENLMDDATSFYQLLDEGKELLDTGYDEYITATISPDEFKILLFTSGTTAAAKGVMLNHKNLCANTKACFGLVPKMGEYTYLSILPMHHTYEFSLVYLYGTAMGATVAICEGLKYVTKNLQEAKPDLIFAVPALIEKISQKIDKAIKETGKEKMIRFAGKITNGLSKVGIDFRRTVFKQVQNNLGGNLKYIFCGAAPLDKDIITKMESYGFIFMQGYGVTEASPLIAGTTFDNREPGTVGKPVLGVEVRIDLSKNKDENNNVGEIIAKGDNIMMGYYENYTETKKALKNGWFYTGDLGYFNLKGNLVISGRTKNVIVTSNGKNIFPEELEHLINKIPLVEESMVYGKEVKGSKEVMVSVKVTLDEAYIEETYLSKRPSDEEIYQMIWEEIKKINRTLVSYKAIKNLEIKKDSFDKTTTLKIKRFVELNKEKANTDNNKK